jgi:hypothetical protein
MRLTYQTEGDYVTVVASRFPFPSIQQKQHQGDWFDSLSRTLQVGLYSICMNYTDIDFCKSLVEFPISQTKSIRFLKLHNSIQEQHVENSDLE